MTKIGSEGVWDPLRGSKMGPKWVQKGSKNDPFWDPKYPINVGENREMGSKKGSKTTKKGSKMAKKGLKKGPF